MPSAHESCASRSLPLFARCGSAVESAQRPAIRPERASAGKQDGRLHRARERVFAGVPHNGPLSGSSTGGSCATPGPHRRPRRRPSEVWLVGGSVCETRCSVAVLTRERCLSAAIRSRYSRASRSIARASSRWLAAWSWSPSRRTCAPCRGASAAARTAAAGCSAGRAGRRSAGRRTPRAGGRRVAGALGAVDELPQLIAATRHSLIGRV
jgi:hypothetical protein